MSVARAKNQRRLPGLIESTLDARHPAAMTLAVLMRPFAVAWHGQRTKGSVRAC